jgi:hypothetical protein
MMLGSLVGGVAFTIFGSQSLRNAGSALFGSFALVFVAGLIAPSKQSKTALIFSCVQIFLALLAFVLSVATNMEGFADRPVLEKILIPVAQIVGVLYAIFLLPPIVIPGATLAHLWIEINKLGITVGLFGIFISLVGLLVGLLGRTWVGLTTGLGVLAVGAATWLFPFVHLFLRFRRIETEISSTAVIGKGIPWESVKGRFLTVIEFTPNASVSGDTVRANSAFEPYAMLTVESPEHNTPILMPVTHRLDFLNLWQIFNGDIVASDEEVFVTYDADKWFGKWLPHVPIMVAPKNTVKKLSSGHLSTSEWVAISRSIGHYWRPPHPGDELRATIHFWWQRFRK